MPFHSDDETSIRQDSAVISVSFGDSRVMAFRGKRRCRSLCKTTVYHGSVLFFSKATNLMFEHCIQPVLSNDKIDNSLGRLSFTFRTMVN